MPLATALHSAASPSWRGCTGSRRFSQGTRMTRRMALAVRAEAPPQTDAAATSSQSASDLLDVAIIGGGPGGLAAALALRRAAPQLRVQIFERTTDQRPRGAGLGIAPNGLKALAAIDPSLPDDLAKRAFRTKKFRTLDPEGNVVREEDVAAWAAASIAKYGYRSLPVGWWELVDTLASKLPKEQVELGVAFEGAEAAPHGVNVFLQGRDEAVKAKLLLGCDGYHSRVWESLIGGAPVAFEETMFWRARVPREEVEDPLDMSVMVMGGGMLCLVFPVSNGDVVWTLSAPSAVLQEHGLGDMVAAHAERKGSQYTGAERLEHCLRVFEGRYPEQVLRLVRATKPETILEHGVWARDPALMPQEGALSDGPWSVLGDAFHPIRPTGEGGSMALEDAAVLGAAAAEHGATPAMLRAYEAKRLPRITKIMENTLARGRSSYSKGGPKPHQEVDGKPYADFVWGVEFEPLGAQPARV